jgi:4-diphosphocytidyl-2-C-methyl-D-erythritol kinase
VSSPSRAALSEDAPAKVNLTLRVLGRRRDGYHNIASLVAFAELADKLAFVAGGPLKLVVRGPATAAVGRLADNLVIKAARLLAAQIGGLILGRFTLTKSLPVAGGLGGGSADAAAALRLLARANRLKRNDPRILKVARRIGADVPVCLDPRARMMRGIGEILSEPIRIPRLHVVLVNPGIALATKDVFARHDRQQARRHLVPAARAAANVTIKNLPKNLSKPRSRAAFIAMLAADRNDLELAAIALAPSIATVLAALRNSTGCRLARMSGSGATCFGLYASSRLAAAATRKLKAAYPRWWVRASVLS